MVEEAFTEERGQLQPLPAHPYTTVLRMQRRLSRDGMVSVEGNEYSVPDTLTRRVIEVHRLAAELRLYDRGALVAVHPVLEGQGQRRVADGHRTWPPPGSARREPETSPGSSARTARDTGKSHLAIALGFEAIRAGKSVFFATLAEIIASLIKAQREGELAARLRFLARPALLIVDEVGYLPLEPGGANLFFQLVNARYEKGAMILTSNRGFREWAQVFGDNVIAAALLDRLLHHAIVIEIDGSSYRLREHAHLMPEALHPTPVSTPPKRGRGRPRKTEVPPSLNG